MLFLNITYINVLVFEMYKDLWGNGEWLIFTARPDECDVSLFIN